MRALTIFNAAMWPMILGREVLRCLLALSGDLEWRGWYTNLGWDWWPEYVTMWNVLFIPIAIWYIWFTWRDLEWKSNGS